MTWKSLAPPTRILQPKKGCAKFPEIRLKISKKPAGKALRHLCLNEVRKICCVQKTYHWCGCMFHHTNFSGVFLLNTVFFSLVWMNTGCLGNVLEIKFQRKSKDWAIPRIILAPLPLSTKRLPSYNIVLRSDMFPPKVVGKMFFTFSSLSQLLQFPKTIHLLQGSFKYFNWWD